MTEWSDELQVSGGDPAWVTLAMVAMSVILAVVLVIAGLMLVVQLNQDSRANGYCEALGQTAAEIEGAWVCVAEWTEVP